MKFRYNQRSKYNDKNKEVKKCYDDLVDHLNELNDFEGIQLLAVLLKTIAKELRTENE